MIADSSLHFVVDTNVVFEGLTKRGGASGYLIDAWSAGLFNAYVTTSLAYEYTDVLTRKLSPYRWDKLQPVLNKLLIVSNWVTVHYSWRPISPDIGDDHVVDCAMNAGAAVVTSNLKDFRSAKESLGLTVLSPVDAVYLLAEG